MKKIVIMGAGAGGLAAAALLAKEGYEVSIYEKNEQPGGRASLLNEKGFKFDMGPSWFMMPDVFDKYFAEFGAKTSDFLKLVPLKPQYRVFFEDGEMFDVFGNLKKDIPNFEKLEKGSGKKLTQYLKESKDRYNLAMETILYKNADNIFQLIDKKLISKKADLRMFLPMEKYVNKFFTSDKLKQILEYNLVFLGCSPDNAPSLFSIMAHVDFNLGVWYPMGGIYELIKTLVILGKMYGVKYYYNSPVKKIITKNSKVAAIVVNGKKINCDILVSNADYRFTERIIDNSSMRSYKDSYWDKKVYAPSAFLIYLGLKGKIPKFLHHTLYFGKDWKTHFREIFNQKKWPMDPSLYINVPSKTDHSVSPKGCENLMILVPVSVGLKENRNWKESYSDYIIEFIENKMKVNIKDKIIYKKVFSVKDFKNRYNSDKGNALGGLAHTLFQSSVFRTVNKSKKLSNLFFVGANTVPGIGVPPAIISAHLVRDRIKKSNI